MKHCGKCEYIQQRYKYLPTKLNAFVIPTKVGIHIFQAIMDSCLRRNDVHLDAFVIPTKLDAFVIPTKVGIHVFQAMTLTEWQ